MPDVIVVGAGPVGTLLAGLLAQTGVEVMLLDKRPGTSPGSRAIGIHAPVLAALEPSGLTERLLASALRVTRGEARVDRRTVGEVRFDRLRARFPFVATLPQAHTETVLAAYAPPAERGVQVTALRPHARVVTLSGAEGFECSAPVVVLAGGSGARNLAYRPGAVGAFTYADRYLMTDIPAPGDDTAIVHLSRGGVLESFPLPGGVRRFVAWDDRSDRDEPAARVDRLRAAVARSEGDDAAASVSDATAFGVRRVVAPAMTRGGLVVIGDTAHEVSPIGGQGMNLGLLDAATLAPLVTDWVRSGERPDAALRRWERRRLASARAAAAIAAMNTKLGRPRGRAGSAARRFALTAALRSPATALVAHAYAMGFDRDA